MVQKSNLFFVGQRKEIGHQVLNGIIDQVGDYLSYHYKKR